MTKIRVSGVPYKVDMPTQISTISSNRISIHDYFMGIADLVAQRGTCIRRKGGCVLINEHNHIIATGYNGPPSGFTHCTDEPCPGALAKSGTNLDKCEAIHAEQNALLQCVYTQNIYACYTTIRPCIHCIKLLLNTSCRVIVFKEDYPHREAVIEMWEYKGGRQFLYIGK